MKVHMCMVFLPDDHYFLFYIFREVLLKSNTCQPHQEEIQKKKKLIQTSKHQGSFKRKEKNLFSFSYFHDTYYAGPSHQNLKCISLQSAPPKTAESQYVSKYSHGNQQPSAVLRLCGYKASFKDAIYQSIYPKYKKSWTTHFGQSFSLNFTFVRMEIICHKTGFHLLILNCWPNYHCFNTEVTYLQALLLTELLSGWSMFIYRFTLTIHSWPSALKS